MSTHVFQISLCYDKKWEIKLCISVNIYRRLPKLGMSTQVFKISFYYYNKWEIKLCISVNIYHRLPKLGMSTHISKLAYAMIKNGRKSYVSQLISIVNFQNLV